MNRPPVDSDFYEIGLASGLSEEEILQDWAAYCEDLEKFHKELEQNQAENPPQPAGEKMPYKIGDRVIWYDHRLWGPRDIGNNEHCRKPGTVVGVGQDEHGQTIDILFDHNPNVSHGHFAYPPYDERRPADEIKSFFTEPNQNG